LPHFLQDVVVQMPRYEPLCARGAARLHGASTADFWLALFAKKYDADMRDVFSLQNRITQDIAMHVPAAAHSARTSDVVGWRTKKPTENLAAYNEYIQGRYLLERLTPEAMAGAKQHFEAAIASDPEFALANMALADFYSIVGYLGHMYPRDAYSIGLRYALRAAEIDDTLAEAHVVLAEHHKQFDFNWPAADREMAKALKLNRASPFVRLRHAILILMPNNRMREAVAEVECALELDPLAGLTRAIALRPARLPNLDGAFGRLSLHGFGQRVRQALGEQNGESDMERTAIKTSLDPLSANDC
jgi:tetratricopeptide (TPR) repeat protein